MNENDQTTEVVATAAETPPETRVAPPVVVSSTLADDLDRVRDIVLMAHPDVVPDLIAGGSVDELIASVEPARGAYQRIADRVREASSREDRDDSSTPRLLDSSTQRVVQPPPVPVPAGAATNVVDPGDLQPLSKIARALAQRRVMGS